LKVDVTSDKLKLIKTNDLGDRVKYYYSINGVLTYDELKSSVKITGEDGKIITPKFVVINVGGENNEFSGNLFSINRVGNDLYTILNSINVNINSGYGTLMIYDIIKKIYVYNGPIRIDDGKLVMDDLKNITVGRQGSFSITLRIGGNSEMVTVFAGQVVYTPVESIGKYIKVTKNGTTYEIRIVDDKFNNYKYLISRNSYNFGGELKTVRNGYVELPVDYVKSIIEGKNIYLMLTNEKNYYVVSVGNSYGGVVVSTDNYDGHLILPDVTTTFNFNNNDFKPSDLMVSIVYVSNRPTVLKVIDGRTYEQYSNVIQKITTIGNIIVYTLYFKVHFDYPLVKVYIYDVTHKKYVPAILNYYYYKNMETTNATIDDVFKPGINSTTFQKFVTSNPDGFRVVLMHDYNINFKSMNIVKYANGTTIEANNTYNSTENNTITSVPILFTSSKKFNTIVSNGYIYYYDDFKNYIEVNGTGDVFAVYEMYPVPEYFEDNTTVLTGEVKVTPFEYMSGYGYLIIDNTVKKIKVDSP